MKTLKVLKRLWFFVFLVPFLTQTTVGQVLTPYSTDFESTEGFTLGSLNTQNGWQVYQGSALIVNSEAFLGTQSVLLSPATPPSIITQSFAQLAGHNVVFVDFYARPSANTDVTLSTLIGVQESWAGFVKVGSEGRVSVLDGNGNGGGSWVSLDSSVPIDQYGQAQGWIRFTFRQDYVQKKWDLYLNGTMAAHGLGFKDNVSVYFSIFKLQGAIDGNTGFDYFYTGYDNPLFVDDDLDGLPDEWEDQQLGTLSYGPNDDPGNVGRTLVQSYQQGLSPWPAPVVADGLRAWFRADAGVTKDGNNKVSQWVDVSGNGFNVSRPTDNPWWLPDFVAGAINGKPALTFSTGVGLITNASKNLLVGANDVTVIVVAAPSAGQGGTILGWLGGGGEQFGLNSYSINQYELVWAEGGGGGVVSPIMNALAGRVQVMSVTKNATNVTSRINGVWQGSGTVPATMAPVQSVLAVGNVVPLYNGFNGKIAEVLVYNRALSDAERAQIEAALSAKYIAADSDGDGLPDAWEDQYLGTLNYGPNDDPGGVGRTLAQSYQQGLIPWPTPVVADGLRAWYRADAGVMRDASNKVSQWTDMSGNGFNVTQTGDPGRQPDFVAGAANGQPVVMFSNGSGLRTNTPGNLFAGGNDVTVIVVAAPSSGQGGTIVGWQGASGQVFGLNAYAINQYQLVWAEGDGNGVASPNLNALAGRVQVMSVTKNATNVTSRINGVWQESGTVPATMASVMSPLAVGNAVAPWYGFTGKIAEVLVYNRALSDAERAQIEAALSAKYIAADSDGDGLPDAWEDQHLGTLNYGPNDDPGNVGRTLAQSYQQGLSPWPAPVVADGLRAWYRADAGVAKDGSAKVSQWTDLSGNSFHVVQTREPWRQPDFVAGAANGQPVVQFAGSSALVTNSPGDLFAGGNDLTVIVVAAPSAEQGGVPTIVGWMGAGSEIVGLSSYVGGQYQLVWKEGEGPRVCSPNLSVKAERVQVMSVVKNSTDVTSRVNGVWHGRGTVPAAMAPVLSPLAVGNGVAPWFGFTGEIAEVLVYNRALSDAERAQIEAALSAKYIAADSDGDGLPDVWEDKYFGTLSYGANDDPGAVGRTLAQSYQQGLSPWPTPVVADGLRAWYRADAGVMKDASNKVSQWTDVSGSGFHVGKISDDTWWQPDFVTGAINGKPAIAFNGFSVLTKPGLTNIQAGSHDVTVITVVKPQATQTNKATILYWGTNGNYEFGLSSWDTNHYRLQWAVETGNDVGLSPSLNVTAGQAHVLSAVKTSEIATSYVNGVLQGAATGAAAMVVEPSPLAVGNSTSPYVGFNGQIAEVLVYNRALSDTERQAIETVLMAEYFPVPDGDGDGLPDAWELVHGLDPNNAEDANTIDPEGDGLTYLQEYLIETHPNSPDSDGDGVPDIADPMPLDYYNGTAPLVVITSGNNQSAAAGSFNFDSLDVAVSKSDGSGPLVNAPVVFTVNSGGGLLAATTEGSTDLSSTLTLRTDAGGVVKIYYQQPLVGGVGSSIVAAAGSAQVTFGSRSRSAGPNLAAGGDQSVWIDATGVARAWGRNTTAQLGDDTAASRAQMMRVAALSGPLASAACGEGHGFAVTKTGLVYAWGDNEFGQLGDGTRIQRRSPVLVAGLQKVVQVAAGDHHSIALLGDGTVWTWGGNQHGQLGDGTTQSRLQPVHIVGLTGIVSIVAGANHSAAVDWSGHVWVWGSNAFGQLADATVAELDTPSMITGLTQVTSLVSGRQHLLALLSDGSIKAWGANEAGQLGLGTTTGQTAPAPIPDLTGIESLASGGSHSLALGGNSVLWTWGANDTGQLGNGSSGSLAVPASLSLSGVSVITAGRDHVIVLKADGTLISWGFNGYDQLGDPSAGPFTTSPTTVSPAQN